MRWLPIDDFFVFLVNHVDFTVDQLKTLTKRLPLADIMKLCDPVGWLAPVTLLLKAFMQVTWEQGLGWDEPLPQEIKEEFVQWREHLVDLRKIKVPRCLLPKTPTTSVQLHVFCDASERGYGACIYVRTVDSAGKVDTRLIMSKSKVSPVKQVSIPRLELLAATVGVQLFQIVTTTFTNANVTWDQVYAYSDSTTVLAWLSRNSRAWVTFVSNRVSAILEVIQRSDWYHVKTADNPADLASRSATSRSCHPGELAENSMWWRGPTLLQAEDFTTPNQDHLVTPTTTEVDLKPEVSHCFFANAQSPPADSTQELFQDLRKNRICERTVRVTVHVIKFLSKFRRYSDAKSKECTQMLVQFNALFNTAEQVPYVTPSQASHVRNVFIKREQLIHLTDELLTLEQGKELHKSHKIHDLYPFVEDGMMKVGGRLAASNSLTDQQKYPVIIAAESPLSDLLIAQAHKTLLHGTKQGCLAALRTKYWIVKAPQKIKTYIRNCTSWFKYVTTPHTPPMGDLPSERVTMSNPWDHTGVDFAGPFHVRAYVDAATTEHDAVAQHKPQKKRGRPKKTEETQRVPRKCETRKAYMAIFVCFASKAVHIEVVGDLPTASCMAAFTRFTARRGKPLRMYSDNGTNFVGSRNEVESLQAALAKSKHAESLPNKFAATGMDWVHIPPRAPHFGGLWEAAVKSSKMHLKKVLGSSVVTFEELSTIFCQIEAIMNSRPLVAMSANDTDYTALTPAMLITGKHHDHLPIDAQQLPSRPPPMNDYPQKTWKFMTKLTAQWWSRWVAEYLPTLQTRSKWRSETPGIWQIGDLVLVAEDNLPPMHWPLARITALHTGNDGHIRAVRIKSPQGEYTRPIVKIRRLPATVNQSTTSQ